MKKYFLMFLVFLLIACEQKGTYHVQYRGSLSAVMMRGDISAKIAMDTLFKANNLYAVGALENLEGEILVLNGISYISSVADSAIKIDFTFIKKAALLVYTQVTHWDTIKIMQQVRDMGELEAIIASVIKKRHLTQPVPFQLQGNVESLEWHVIQPKKGGEQSGHEGHMNTGFKGILKNENNVFVLGFFSTQHQGTITHHDSFTHMHFKSGNDRLAGHVDNIIPKGEVNLLLPGM